MDQLKKIYPGAPVPLKNAGIFRQNIFHFEQFTFEPKRQKSRTNLYTFSSKSSTRIPILASV